MAVRSLENRGLKTQKPGNGRLQRGSQTAECQSEHRTRAILLGIKTSCAAKGTDVLLHLWGECHLCFPSIPFPPSQTKAKWSNQSCGCRNQGHSGPSLTNVESPFVRFSILTGRPRKTLSGVLIHLSFCLPGCGPNSTNLTHALPSENTPPWRKRF